MPGVAALVNSGRKTERFFHWLWSGPFVVPAKSVVDVQLRADLEGILCEEAVGVHEDLAVRVSEGDEGGIEPASKKVGQRIGVGVAGISGVPRVVYVCLIRTL